MKTLVTAAAPLWALLPAPLAPAQVKPPDYRQVATFRLDGKEQVVSRQQVALELGRTSRVREAGAEAINHLIDMALVKQAATRHGLMPSREDVKGQMRVIDASLLERKQDLDQLLQSRRITRHSFRDQLTMGIAKQRLVLEALGEKDRQATPTELALWSKEARQKAKVIVDREQLPAGVVAKVNDSEISLADLGDILFMKVKTKTLHKTVKDLVFRAVVRHVARQQRVGVTPQDLDAYLRQRQQRHKQRGSKLAFAEILKVTTGLTVEQYKKQDPQLRTKVLFRKLAAKKYPASELLDRYLADKENILKRHGARRKISVLLVRATDRPNKLVKRDPEAAAKRAAKLLEEIRPKKTSFADIARKESDGPNRKTGGAMGWQHRQDPDASLPAEVLEAAFQVDVGEVTDPIRTKQGFWLVWVTGSEPEPDPEVVTGRLRGELRQEYLVELYKAADVKIKLR